MKKYVVCADLVKNFDGTYSWNETYEPFDSETSEHYDGNLKMFLMDLISNLIMCGYSLSDDCNGLIHNDMGEFYLIDKDGSYISMYWVEEVDNENESQIFYYFSNFLSLEEKVELFNKVCKITNNPECVFKKVRNQKLYRNSDYDTSDSEWYYYNFFTHLEIKKLLISDYDFEESDFNGTTDVEFWG